MKENNFESELPNGYRLIKTIDAKDKKIGIIFNLLAIVIFFVVFAIGFIPLIVNTEKLSEFDGFGEMMLGLLGVFVYIVLHELVHGIAYKIKTGEKLTFGMSWSCAFCGVPRIFTYRKTALFAVLAPLVVFTAVFIPMLVITYFYNISLYVALLFIFGMHLGGSTGDAYVAILLLTKYKDDTTLMNDTGPKMTFFTYDEFNLDIDEKTKEFIEAFNRAKEKLPIDEKAKLQKNKTTSIVCIVFFSLSFLFNLLLIIFRNRSLYPYDALKVYELLGFYACVISAIVIITTAFTMKKLFVTKIIAIALLILLSMPVTLISAFQVSFEGKSYTTNIENYGIYDYNLVDDHFPQEVTENMTPVYYSYYLDGLFDIVYELYLEVEMPNEEYEKYKSQYENDLKECFFAPKYTEYVLSDKTSVYTVHSLEEGFMDSPDIRKIIFNDEERIIIFLSIYGLDPFYYENSYYFKRFKLDPIEYSNYLKENQK